MPWHCKAKGGYANNSQEAIDNAKMCYEVLSARGWTKNAVAGMLGNASHEGGMNPWRWQSDNIGSTGGSPWTSRGYGLLQFTPAGKYINNARNLAGYGPNFSNQAGKTTDGQAQLLYMDTAEGYYPTSTYKMTFSQFKKSTASGGELARIWLYNYERPADPSATVKDRMSSGDYWLSVLQGETPSTPDPGGDEPVTPEKPVDPLPHKKMPIWMMTRRFF